MAGQISGTYVAVTAVGGVLVWSGWANTSLKDTFRSLLSGKLPAPGTGGVTSPGAAGTSAAGDASGSASQNYLTIAEYLVQNGYSNAAAAGIVGCIAGESGGNPEALEAGGGGGGLIQWTPYQSYGVPITGNASADLQAQLPLIIAYNNAQGSNLVAMLNQISDPVQAADFYSRYFERPAVANSDVRSGVATSVYSQLQKAESASLSTVLGAHS